MGISAWIILIISSIGILEGVLIRIFFKRSEEERAGRIAAEDRANSLKRNIAYLSAAITSDYEAQGSGGKITQKIKEAKSNEEAQSIMDSIAANIDRLL